MTFNLGVDRDGNLAICTLKHLLNVPEDGPPATPRQLSADGSSLPDLIEVATTILALGIQAEALGAEDEGLVAEALVLAREALAIASGAVAQALLVELGSSPTDPTAC